MWTKPGAPWACAPDPNPQLNPKPQLLRVLGLVLEYRMHVNKGGGAPLACVLQPCAPPVLMQLMCLAHAVNTVTLKARTSSALLK